ncbi:sensor histidine kinase [Mucilaginibacter calamicampi]|uniref:Sensor histidine kinase n=1 Tax=Mucilaginibacter calamicampi TaxID=1302352 RepID=A0ABW2Z1Q9_9SPHI
MKLHISKIIATGFICLIYTTAPGQKIKIDTAMLPKYWNGYGVHYIGLNKSPAVQRAIINKEILKRSLAKEHYFFSQSAKLLGIGFTGGSGKKSEIYRGQQGDNSIIIDGNCAVQFAAADITPANAKDFRYHVVQNNRKELVSWTKPTVFKKTADGKITYAYLGRFDYVPGQVLKVEVYNVNNYAYSDAAFIDWRKAEKPEIYSAIQYFSAKHPLPDGSLYAKYLTDTQRTVETYGRMIGEKYVSFQRPVSVKDFIETIDKNDIRFRADDSVKNVSFHLLNRDIAYNNKVTLTRPTENGTETIQLGEANNRIEVIKDIWRTPGKYKITFTPWLVKHGGWPVHKLDSLATSITFTVLPAEKKYIPLRTVISIILILMTAVAINFTLYRNRQKRKLAQEAQNRQIATLQLQSVRSQLNPHFIFNALAGIQNLINKNAIEDANKYLTRFARLTRNVLDDGQKDLISIEKETDLLNDYLQMEQTRFGFNYNLKVDERLDLQIEIPAMLLQPFVENAVKHGISALKEKGQVDVSITQSDNGILLKVRDNGNGFKGDLANGKGIKLCRERITLLNSIHKNTHILLHIDPSDNGTVITIELKNWL